MFQKNSSLSCADQEPELSRDALVSAVRTVIVQISSGRLTALSSGRRRIGAAVCPAVFSCDVHADNSIP